MIARGEPKRGVTVWGSMQCPYYIHQGAAPALRPARRAIRVVQMETGGGFGGKEEYPVDDRRARGAARLEVGPAGEDDLRPRRRHGGDDEAAPVADAASHGGRRGRKPGRDGHRLHDRRRRLLHAVAGRAVARDDSCGRAVLVPERAHPRPRGRDQRSAARRVPRLRRAAEHLRARAAHGQGRRRRRARAGRVPAAQLHQARATRWPSARRSPRRWTCDRRCIGSRAWQLSAATTRSAAREFAARERIRAASCKKGIGLATFMHGAGFTGSGEVHLASVVAVEGTPDGRVRVLAASTEIGQGTNTIFSQIAADALRHRLRRHRGRAARHGRRARQRADGRVAHLHGRRQAGRDRGARHQARADRRRLPAGGLLARGVPGGLQALRRARSDRCAATSQYELAAGLVVGRREVRRRRLRHLRRGRCTWRRCRSIPTTCETRVDDFVAVQEVGKVINPMLAAGQIEGGVAQGIGWALYENVVWREGRMVERADDQLHHADVDGPAADPRVLRRDAVSAAARPARRASASCRWTAPRRRSSTPSRTRPASTSTRAAADARAPDGADGASRCLTPRRDPASRCTRQRRADGARTGIRWRACSTCCATTRASPARRRVAAKGSAAPAACCSTARSSTAA